MVGNAVSLMQPKAEEKDVAVGSYNYKDPDSEWSIFGLFHLKSNCISFLFNQLI